MNINIKDVEHIAKLSRLSLSASEKKKFAPELSSILDYVEQLNEINTNKVQPTAQVTGLTNVMREDLSAEALAKAGEIEKFDKEEREGILNQSPDRDGDFIKVKSVF